MKKMKWLKPELAAQVEFVDWTENNHLRHSKFAGLRDDKPAQEVRREDNWQVSRSGTVSPVEPAINFLEHGSQLRQILNNIMRTGGTQDLHGMCG